MEHSVNPMQTKESTDFVNMLRAIPELSVDKALSVVGGSDKSYEHIVNLTIRLLPENITKLNNLIKTNLPSYAIEIHGVKGVLNNIGAYELGETAYKLEMLSKDGNIDACMALHPDFITALTNFSESIMIFINQTEDKDKQEGNIALLLEALPRIEEAADYFDSILALEILTSFSKYTYGQELDQMITILISAFEQFDFDKAAELMERLKFSTREKET